MSFFSTTSSSADSKVAAAATAAATLESTTTGATNNGEGGSNKTPHYHFIHSMILPSTVKIQKELKGRKFKVRFALCLCVLCIY